MKTFFIISFLLSIIEISANELTWVDQQIQAIKPPRSGLSTSTTGKLRNSFIFLKKNGAKEETSSLNSKSSTSTLKSSSQKQKISSKKRAKAHIYFTLAAIMNDSALINSKWYKIDDTIYGYRVSNIYTEDVLLVKKGKKIVLSTKSKNKNLKFKSE